eukprot:scaffold8234_cov113-Skeletonema_dohrnii-CCMP3373.AAC.5
MKLSAAIITLLAGSAAAFAPAMPSVAVRASSIQQQTVMFAEPKEEEEGGLDLDLDEMFSMYVTCRNYHCVSNVFVAPCVKRRTTDGRRDNILTSIHAHLLPVQEVSWRPLFDAADKGEDFDKAIKDVKKDN